MNHWCILSILKMHLLIYSKVTIPLPFWDYRKIYFSFSYLGAVGTAILLWLQIKIRVNTVTPTHPFVFISYLPASIHDTSFIFFENLDKLKMTWNSTWNFKWIIFACQFIIESLAFNFLVKFSVTICIQKLTRRMKCH